MVGLPNKTGGSATGLSATNAQLPVSVIASAYLQQTRPSARLQTLTARFLRNLSALQRPLREAALFALFSMFAVPSGERRGASESGLVRGRPSGGGDCRVTWALRFFEILGSFAAQRFQVPHVETLRVFQSAKQLSGFWASFEECDSCSLLFNSYGAFGHQLFGARDLVVLQFFKRRVHG